MKVACGWLYTLNRYGYPPTYEGVLAGIDKAAEWGFAALEMEAIGEENLHRLNAHRQEIRDRIHGAGLSLVNFVPMLPDVVSLDRPRREHALDLFRLGVELGSFLGTQMIMCDSYEVPLSYVGEAPGIDPVHYGKSYRVEVTADFSWDRVWENLVAVIGQCTGIVAESGLRLGMELRMGEAVSNTDAFLRLYGAVGNPNLGVVFDTAHLHAQKEILPLSVEKLKDRIFLIHASDNDSRENRHLPLGQGTIDWATMYRALHKHLFDGYTVLDIGDCQDLEEGYLDSKLYLQDLGV